MLRGQELVHDFIFGQGKFLWVLSGNLPAYNVYLLNLVLRVQKRAAEPGLGGALFHRRALPSRLSVLFLAGFVQISVQLFLSLPPVFLHEEHHCLAKPCSL